MRAPTQEQSRWIGRVLRDKWRIDARIARGGVGTVWAATHKNNGMTVAIKVLHSELAGDRDARSRFLQEGYAANQVAHPGVVRILDDDVTEEGLAFIVMELLEGELLETRRIRNGGRLPLAEVCEIADQLLDVIAAAHDKGIVHRDIKPENLFLTSQGTLKVLDFGFAQMKHGLRQERTATGFLLGTPGFMSPEQAVGNRAMIDAHTDIWAIGATLFTLISGEPVHEGESAAELLVASANYQARPLGQVMPNVPPRLAQVVDKALAYEKTQRWANARTMQAALRAVPGHVLVGQRSTLDDPFEDRTVMQPVDELRTDEYEIAKDSWQTEETVASDRMSTARSSTAPRDRLPSLDDSVQRERTVIMEGSPSQPATATPKMMPPRGPYASAFQNTPQAFAIQQHAMSDPHGAAPVNDMMFVAGPAHPAPAPRGGLSRMLVLVSVALVSMVIVIVTGLIILAASD